MKSLFVIIAVTSLSAVSLHAQKADVDAVANAMGGADRILGVRTLILEGSGENYNLGQNVGPDDALPVYTVSDFRRAIDFSNKLWRQQQVRAPKFLTGNTSPVRQVIGSVGDVGYTISPDNKAVRTPLSGDAERRITFYSHPLTAMRLALQSSSVTPVKGMANAFLVVAPTGEKIEVHFDSKTHLPTRTVALMDQVNLGDVQVVTTFDGYSDVNGLKLPTRISTTLDKWKTVDLNITRQTIDGDVGDLTVAKDILDQPAPFTGAQIEVEELASGVWYLTGQSHHSVLVEMADHMMLIEAPLNEARVVGLMQMAQQIRAGKPLTTLVVTHHHFDHSAGLRTAASQNLIIYAHESTKKLFQNMVTRKHTMVEDSLGKRWIALNMRAVGDKTIIDDLFKKVELYHIKDSPHASDMLMVYLPHEHLLIEADVYSPPAANAPANLAFPFAKNLVENVEKRGLKVDRVVPIHGKVVSWQEVLSAAGR